MDIDDDDYIAIHSIRENMNLDRLITDKPIYNGRNLIP